MTKIQIRNQGLSRTFQGPHECKIKDFQGLFKDSKKKFQGLSKNFRHFLKDLRCVEISHSQLCTFFFRNK